MPYRISEAQRARAGTIDPGRRQILRAGGGMLAAAGTGLWLTGCGQQEAGTGRDAVTFLTVVPLTSLTFSPELLADTAGFFADNNIDISFQATRGSAQAVQLVLAGGAPLTRIGQIEAVSHAANRGAPILNIGTSIKESTIRIVSSSADPLVTPADIAGKRLGIPSEGGESETTLDLVLASTGVALEAVERQVVGVGPGVFNLVERGDIAGFMVSIDTARILQAQNSNAVVLNPADFIESGTQLYMIARENFDAYRDLMTRYLGAVREAIRFIINDDGFDQTLALIRQKYAFGTLDNTEVARQSLGDYVRAWTRDGEENILLTNDAHWQRGYTELARLGLVPEGENPSAWYTNELVEGLG